MSGYIGKVLRINLKQKSVKVEALDIEKAKQFIGGRGLGTKLFMDEVDPNVDAFSPENKLFIVAGPLTGTNVPTGGRYMVVTKSPLSGTIASSNSGGHWGAELKAAGYDLIIIEEKADEPVYITIVDDKVEIKEASKLWGKLVTEVTNEIKTEMPDKAKILAIGPAGEQLSRMAAIMNDYDRAAGRSGVGAVMGSKNLKAIAVKGSGKTPIFDEAKLKDALQTRGNQVVNLFSQTSVKIPIYSSALSADDRVKRNSDQGIFQRINDIFEDNTKTTGKKGLLLEKAGIKGNYTEFNNLLTTDMVNKQKYIDLMKTRMATKEDQYYSQFAKLETAMNKMNSQSSWIAQQMGGQ